MPTTNQKLEALARAHIDGRMAFKVMYYSELNPEQKLAHVLDMLVEHKKGTLALMQTLLLLAEETKVWKDTPEGVAWREAQAKKRADKKAVTVNP